MYFPTPGKGEKNRNGQLQWFVCARNPHSWGGGNAHLNGQGRAAWDKKRGHESQTLHHDSALCRLSSLFWGGGLVRFGCPLKKKLAYMKKADYQSKVG